MHDDELAIRTLIADWLEASKAGDTAKVLSLMSDDVVFLTPGRPPMCGKAAFASASAGLAQFRFEGVSDVQEIRVLGDWAYCWTKLEIVMTPVGGGASIKRAGTTLSILRKLPTGNWVIVRDANMLAVVSS